MKPILLVEDDKNLSLSLSTYLKNEGYVVETAATLAEAERKLTADISLILLDWMLPDGQGIDFLKKLRARGVEIPILLMTARSELSDKVVGLETGANDYLTKPVEARELVARIRAHLRPRGQSEATTLKVGNLTLDRVKREVMADGKPIELRKLEFDLLLLLMENPNKVLSREEILNKVWGYDSFPTTRTIDMHILQLRQKAGDTLIETVRGVGYRLKVAA